MWQQRRLLPPWIFLHRRQAEQPDQHDNQQATTGGTENHTEKTIGAGQSGDADQFADQVIDQRANQQGDDEE
ncbi:hypothetical protein D3C72_2550920 [compost metagenome]